MRRSASLWQTLVLVLLFLFLFPGPLGDAVLPTDFLADHGGRSISLPSNINKVYATTEAGLFLAYALNPDCILGWNRGLSPELEFAIQPQYHALPTLGTWDQTFQTIC